MSAGEPDHGVLARFRNRLWRPPRAHGDLIADRTVSFLELFYDLIYVVLIARVAHPLAENVTWSGFGEFGVVFGLIWLAWANGSLYQDLHGRDDIRSRTFIFLQMLILCLLAVGTARAAHEDGRLFAGAYTALLAVLSWLWFTVLRQDEEDSRRLTSRFLVGMILSGILMAGSVALPDRPRLAVWTVVVVGWAVGMFVLDITAPSQVVLARNVGDSLVERFGLFVIIVLGEVVAGVVTGLSEAARDPRTITTGMLGLAIGFGIWWTYFDLVSRRLPKQSAGSMTLWMLSQLPVALSIAASGAAMVSLVEHAGDAAAPAGSAWLLAGSVATALLALVFTMWSLHDYRRFPALYKPLSFALPIAGGAALAVGALRPAPWALALWLFLILVVLWLFAVDRWLRLDDPDAVVPK